MIALYILGSILVYCIPPLVFFVSADIYERYLAAKSDLDCSGLDLDAGTYLLVYAFWPILLPLFGIVTSIDFGRKKWSNFLDHKFDSVRKKTQLRNREQNLLNQARAEFRERGNSDLYQRLQEKLETLYLENY